MKKLSLKQFSEINLYNNKNIEKLMSEIISESANATFVSLFEDQVILFDNIKNKFYSADYEFDKSTFVIENFEELIITRELESFNESLNDYFDDKTDIEEVCESYDNIFSEAELILTEDINNNILKKKNTYEFFNDILEAKNKVKLDKIYETELYKKYSERYMEKPSEEIYFFDWHNPIAVSLEENESKKPIFIKDDIKALNFWKNENFRKMLKESLSDEDKVESFLNTYKQLILLENVKIREVVSKSLLMENVTDVNTHSKSIIDVIVKNGLRELLKENFTINEEEVQQTTPPIEGNEQTTDQAGEESAEDVQVDTSELDQVVSDIKNISSECQTEKAKSFLDGIVTKLEQMKEEGSIDPELLKEIARLLAPVPEETEQTEEQPIEGDTNTEQPTPQQKPAYQPSQPKQSAGV